MTIDWIGRNVISISQNLLVQKKCIYRSKVVINTQLNMKVYRSSIIELSSEEYIGVDTKLCSRLGQCSFST